MWGLNMGSSCPTLSLSYRRVGMLPSSSLQLDCGGLRKIGTGIVGGGHVGHHGLKLLSFRCIGWSRKEGGHACAVNNRSDTVLGLAIVLMGVSGCGKSTIGELLSKSVPCPFIDADDFHSAENKEKMRSGVSLTEEDRLPWLEKLRNELTKYINKGETVVLACSALQPLYRDILLSADPFFHRVQDEQEIATHISDDKNFKSSQNDRHTAYSGKVVFIHLKSSVELLTSRLAARHKEGKHYMSPDLLKSQLDLLEIRGDNRVITVDASLSPDDIVKSITKRLLHRV